MTHTRLAVVLIGLTAFAALFAYPLFYVVFPWTVPVPYLAAMAASLVAVLLAVCE